MKSPFPSMDLDLEHPSLWPDVHNRLITAIADDLSERVAPRYYVGLERRTYLLKADDFRSWTNFVEIDLLRAGEPIPGRFGGGGFRGGRR